MSFSRYNKGRPFLIISHSATPAQGQNTSAKNWGTEGKWNINESIAVVDSITQNQMYTAAIIIDILQHKMIKNRFADTHDEKEIIKHYFSKYNKEVVQGIQIWTKSRARDKKDAEQLIQDLNAELQKIDLETETTNK